MAPDHGEDRVALLIEMSPHSHLVRSCGFREFPVVPGLLTGPPQALTGEWIGGLSSGERCFMLLTASLAGGDPADLSDVSGLDYELQDIFLGCDTPRRRPARLLTDPVRSSSDPQRTPSSVSVSSSGSTDRLRSFVVTESWLYGACLEWLLQSFLRSAAIAAPDPI